MIHSSPAVEDDPCRQDHGGSRDAEERCSESMRETEQGGNGEEIGGIRLGRMGRRGMKYIYVLYVG